GQSQGGQEVVPPELASGGRAEGVLAHLLEGVVEVPAVAGQPERERAGPEYGGVGQRGRDGEAPARPERDGGQDRGALGQRGLLREERGAEQQAGHDRSPGGARPSRRVQGGGA